MNAFLIPDLLLLLTPFLVITIRIFTKNSKPAFIFANLSFLVIFILLNHLVLGEESHVFFSTWKVDRFGVLMREILILGAFLGIWFAKDYFDHRADHKSKLTQMAEYIAALMFATFGGFAVLSATELLTLFLGLEIATVPMYALTAWNKSDPNGSEAGTKFILMGSVATAFELFGLSYLYGFAGTLELSLIAEAVAQNMHSPLLWISVLFLICGIGFKLTLFPFHTWAPDVYDGAPTPTTAVLSVTSKLVAIIFLMVLLFGPFAAIHSELIPFISLLAAVTLFAGNLGALKQNRLRRFMAYSSISQAGYILIALIGPESLAKGAVAYYFVVYTIANYLAFFVFGVIGRNRSETFESLHGLSKQSPVLATALAIAAFSLAGIPPLAGFLGKFHLFYSAAEVQGYILILFAVVNNVLALYYYIQLIKAAWVDEPKTALEPLTIGLRQKMVIIVLMIGTLTIGVFPFLNTNIFRIVG